MTTIEIKVPSDNEEGTTMKIQNWLKSIGDTVSKDEPLVEIETDKVTMEIEAPADGVLTEIISEIGQDVGVGAVIGKLSTAQTDSTDPKPNTPPKAVADTPKSPPQNKQTSAPNPGLSPSVRRYVAQHNLDVSGLSGTGKGGRLTLADVKSYHSDWAIASKPKGAETSSAYELKDQIIPHSNMRLSIAKHMSGSVATAPHVTAIFEMDFTSIMAHRAACLLYTSPSPRDRG